MKRVKEEKEVMETGGKKCCPKTAQTGGKKGKKGERKNGRKSMPFGMLQLPSLLSPGDAHGANITSLSLLSLITPIRAREHTRVREKEGGER